ncbi:hypothetical protein PRZ48_013267 [Zasmidium cellare]|uniref:Vegetative incompatibility protein HET-E-1 n=1 Tax=Zasmidium cellare TaxID=395010 RepID=A0ABR0E3J4_ZASCE|nr:hypothetical protein PRZ48_013267 [Zasmidium cellare]
MRLLNVNSLEFCEFYNRPIPSYVIASHRWASGEREEDREATYLEVKEGRSTNTTGFKKVRNFAEYVRTRIPGVEWLWVDTCCVNKQDAQELTEAINSMFRWYSAAAVCLAWMADVDNAHDHQGFKSSGWFKRGWTLQELLAPSLVVFLSKDWRIMGHKSSDTSNSNEVSLDPGPSLNAIITQITGIPEKVLLDFQNGKALSVEERLAWMKDRRTTREEDMSYCLVGILDAPMVAIYGEGGDKARRRLLAEVSRDDSYLERLPVAQGAAFDDRENELVSACLPNTRVKLLEDISAWASSNNGACIFWLIGMAGTGKSTILKTVAQRFKERCHLAASFCFKKGEADRGHASRLIPSIATQLAQRIPKVRQKLISVLKENPDIVRKSLKEQFQSLIFQPLEYFGHSAAGVSAWIIGIDALDECDDETDIRIVIDLFARLEKLRAANIRLFVTSRPELPVRLGFHGISENTHLDVRLEEVTKDHITHDIAIYLRHKVAEIRSSYATMYDTNVIGHDWPGDHAIEALIEMAQPLFIFAATACRLLGELDEDPNETLRMILDHRLEASQLDRTYGPVLEKLVLRKTEKQQRDITQDFQILVGAIVLLQDPLPAPALSRLLDVSESKVYTRLTQLHSVLDVPAVGDRSREVRPLHLSFRDYLTDPDKRDKTPFWINEVQTHRSVARQCLRLLAESRQLQQDLCVVGQPGTRRVEIGRERVREHIPADVAYACNYWVWHLTKGEEHICDNGPVHRFLQRHLLHWLEALSWLGKLSGAISSLNDLNSLVQVEQGDELLAFLADAKRFLLRNRYVIDLAPLQIYSAALVFAPSQSIVRRHFQDSIPYWIQLGPKVASNWDSEIQTLEGHTHRVGALAFSPDGKVVASGSWDSTARLWNTWTGEEMCKFEGHSHPVYAVAFSRDGQSVATASRESIRRWNVRTGEITHEVNMQLRQANEPNTVVMNLVFSPNTDIIAEALDGTVRLRNIWTGDKMYAFEGYPECSQAVAFAPDGQTVAIGSRGLKVHVYKLSTGEKVHELKMKTGDEAIETGWDDGHFISALAFSPDGTFLASGTGNGKLWLWNSSMHKKTCELEGHRNTVDALAFSSDGRTLASKSGPHFIMWHTHTGERRTSFNRRDDQFTTLALSPDGQIVLSGSRDATIRLWDTRVSEEMQSFEGHSKGTTSVSFSPDGLKVVTGGKDKTVRVWNAQTGDETQRFQGHDDWVRTAVLSPDGQKVASHSGDNTIRLWDANTSQETHRLGAMLAAFSTNGFIASVSTDGTMRLWDTRTGEVIREFEEHEGSVRAIALSSDAETAVTALETGMMILWNTRTGKETRQFDSHEGLLETVAISSNAAIIATASVSPGETVSLFDAGTGVKIHQFTDVGYVSKLAFSEDGACLKTDYGNLDITPYFSLSTGSGLPGRMPRVLLHEQWIRHLDQDLLWLPKQHRGVCWDAHGNTIATGHASGAVSFFRLKPDEHE